jgi:hypothetical protein
MKTLHVTLKLITVLACLVQNSIAQPSAPGIAPSTGCSKKQVDVVGLPAKTWYELDVADSVVLYRNFMTHKTFIQGGLLAPVQALEMSRQDLRLICKSIAPMNADKTLAEYDSFAKVYLGQVVEVLSICQAKQGMVTMMMQFPQTTIINSAPIVSSIYGIGRYDIKARKLVAYIPLDFEMPGWTHQFYSHLYGAADGSLYIDAGATSTGNTNQFAAFAKLALQGDHYKLVPYDKISNPIYPTALRDRGWGYGQLSTSEFFSNSANDTIYNVATGERWRVPLPDSMQKDRGVLASSIINRSFSYTNAYTRTISVREDKHGDLEMLFHYKRDTYYARYSKLGSLLANINLGCLSDPSEGAVRSELRLYDDRTILRVRDYGVVQLIKVGL